MNAKTQEPIREKFNQFIAAYFTAEQRQRLGADHLRVLQDCFFSGAIAAHINAFGPDEMEAEEIEQSLRTIIDELENYMTFPMNNNYIKTAVKD